MATFGQAGIALSGLNERANGSQLIGFMNSNGVNIGNIDSQTGGTPWCAAFTTAVLKSEGYSGSNAPLSAQSYLNYGQSVSGAPQVGDVAVFTPANTGISHVGIVTGFDGQGNPLVLQGNSADSVRVESEDPSKLVFRRPVDSNGNTPVQNGATGTTDGVSNGQSGAQSANGGGSGGGDGNPSAGPSNPSTGGPDTQGGTTGGSNAQPVPGQGGFLDNPLNPYAQIAYHFTLFVTGDQEVGESPSRKSGTIIAETGATGFNIKEVVMNGFIGPSSVTRTSTQTKMKIVVTEAMGTSFLDGLVVAHQARGTQNYQKAFYWLHCMFKGYTEQGAVQDPITSGMPTNDGSWVYRIAITDIGTSLNEGGAIYTLECVVLHDVALKDEWLKVQNPISVTADTVKEFFDNLCKQLNATVLKNYTSQFVNYSYQFVAANGMPDPSSYKLIRDEVVGTDSYRNRTPTEKDRDKFRANLQRGQNLTELPELIAACTVEGQSLMVFGDATHTRADMNKRPDGGFRCSVVYRTYPKITYAGYDPTNGNYKKNITFIVKPYQTQNTFLHPKETDNADKILTFAKPLCRKRYDYIFTGLNTEVIGFDIKFNMAWQASLARYAGWDYYTEQAVHSAVYDGKYVQAQQQFDQQQASQTQANQATAQSIQNTTASALGAGNPFGGGGNVANNILGAVTSINSNSQAKAAAVSQVEASRQATAIQSSAGGQSGYVEDILAQPPTQPFTKLSIAQNAEAARRAAGSGVPSPRSTRARSVYGSLLDQQYDPSTYQNVEVEIRGDPFWIGGKYEDRWGSGSAQGSAPDITAGDTLFLLVFKYPYGVHESTGQPQFRPEQTYTGLYQATEVESRFVEGRFTQVLKAHRLPKVDAQKALSLNGGQPAQSGSSASSGNGGSSGSGSVPGLGGTPGGFGAALGSLGGGATNGVPQIGSLLNSITGGSNGLTPSTVAPSGGTLPTFSPTLSGIGGGTGNLGGISLPQSGTGVSLPSLATGLPSYTFGTTNGAQNQNITNFGNVITVNPPSTGIDSSNIDLNGGSDSDWR